MHFATSVRTAPRAVARSLSRLAALAAGVALTGCASVAPTADAQSDVRAFVIALRDGDNPAIEAGLDRRALEAQSAELAAAVARGEASRALGPGLIGGIFGDIAAVPSALFAPNLLDPNLLTYIAQRAGLMPETRVPGPIAAAFFLRPTGPGQVCAPDRATSRCLLTFTDQGDRWRLTFVDPDVLEERIAQRRVD